MDTNEFENVENEQMNNEISKKNNSGIIFIIILAILAVLIFCIAYYTENAKNKGDKFLTYITKDQYIVEMVKGNQKPFENGEKELSFVFFNEDGSSPGSFDVEMVAKDSKYDGKLLMNVENEKMTILEFLKEDNTVAFRIPELDDEFVAVSNENLIELGEKFGFNLDAFKDEDSTKEAKELLERLGKKYSKTIAKAISKHIKVDAKEKIEIDGESYTTELYELDVDTKTMAAIYKDILDVLVKDEEGIALIAAFIAQQEGTDLEDTYTEVLETLEEDRVTMSLSGLISEEDNVDMFKLCVYVKDGKTIKTDFFVYNDNEESCLILEAVGNDKKDFVKFEVINDDEKASIAYKADKKESGIDSEIIITATDGTSSKMKVITSETEKTSKEVRTLKEVEHLLLNEATDEELNTFSEKYLGMTLEEFKMTMQSNDDDYDYNYDYNYDYDYDYDYDFDYDFDYSYNTKYEKGEFKLRNPNNQVKVLDIAKKVYKNIELGMSKEAVRTEMKKLGLTEDSFGGDYLYFELDNVSIASIGFDKVGVSSVNLMVYSSDFYNVQISKELGTPIEDLDQVVGKLKEEMTKDEVIKILGTTYLETYKNDYGYTSIKWYDQNENIVEVDFDDENIAYYIGKVEKDF